MFKKNGITLISEAAESDATKLDLVDAVEAEEELMDEYETVADVEEDIQYTAETVAVFQIGDTYVVESDNLYKLMESTNTDVHEAMSMIAEHHSLNIKDMALLIESKKALKKDIDEKEDKKSLVDKAKDTIKNIKKGKFKVFKKK